MPQAPNKACLTPGCPGLAGRASGYCAACATERQRVYDRKRGSAAERGYDRAWRRRRLRILRRDPICRTEGCTRPSEEVDHVLPRRRGGSDADDNLQGLCGTCHSRKTAIEDGRWGQGSLPLEG